MRRHRAENRNNNPFLCIFANIKIETNILSNESTYTKGKKSFRYR